MTAARSLLLTGATSGLGSGLLRQFATRPDWTLVLPVRSAERIGSLRAALPDAVAEGRAHFVVCDQADLSSVRAGAAEIAELIGEGVIPPLSSIVLNAGVMRRDARCLSVDGLELTTATNLIGPHALLALLSPHITSDGRILIVGSNVIHKAWWHRITGVRAPQWCALDEQLAPSDDGPQAYARTKLGLLYLSLALSDVTPQGVSTVYFDPGVMPGTNILRERTRASQVYWREVLPYLTWAFGGVRVGRVARTLRPYALHEVPLPGWSHVSVRSKKRYRIADGDAERIRDYFTRANEICGVGATDAAPWWWRIERIGARRVS